MKRIHVILVSSLFTAVAVAANSQEKKIARNDLPAAVEKTVAAESKGATIKGFSKETEKGKTYYEAEMTVNGRGKDVSIDEQGNIVEVEEQVEMKDLPAAVQQGLKKAAGSSTITKIESLTKRGKLVAYEAAIRSGSKHSEVQVGPDGNKLAHAE